MITRRANTQVKDMSKLPPYELLLRYLTDTLEIYENTNLMERFGVFDETAQKGRGKKGSEAEHQGRSRQASVSTRQASSSESWPSFRACCPPDLSLVLPPEMKLEDLAVEDGIEPWHESYLVEANSILESHLSSNKHDGDKVSRPSRQSEPAPSRQRCEEVHKPRLDL